MKNKQSWESCKYAIGDLDTDVHADVNSLKNHPRLQQILEAINSEDKYDKWLREEGIHRWYYCINPEILNLEIYAQNIDGTPNKEKEYTKLVRLFRIHISEWYETGGDPLGEQRDFLDQKIKYGLRMCTHCKFYRSLTD